jgi:hypothetical protein
LESSSPALEPFEEFIFSIILVLLVFVVIVISYYNIALAFRGHPPFKVCEWIPQILFPRGARGLGKHNVEDEGGSLLTNVDKNVDKNYKPISGSTRNQVNRN